ncbi:MAG: hypothetical protein Q7S38_01595 [bacterium]|nr:hypothetical protein [bacterium]
MITLHKATQETRLLLKWGAILFGIIIFIILAIRIGGSLKEYFFPTPLPPPTVLFGKLPPIVFKEVPPLKKLIYSLNTLSGTLPKFPNQLPVYKLIQPEPSLFARDKAQEKVSQLGFSQQGIPLSETLYQWREENYPFRKLSLNILSYNFDLTSNFLSNSQILSPKQSPDKDKAIADSQSFLSTISDFTKDLDFEKTKSTLLTIQDSQLKEATSLSEAKLTRIDFYQKSVNELPVYYPHPPFSAINFLVSNENIVEAHGWYHKIDPDSATYPIETAEEAFDFLKKGKASIVSYFGDDTKISIKNVTLGYYLEDVNQDYAMPIIIFEGSNGFFAYVSAVSDEWIKSN